MTAILSIILFFSTTYAAQAVPAGNTKWVSLGSKDGKLSASLGARSGSTGWEIGFSNTEDYLPSEINKGTAPTGTYSNIGDRNINGTYGVDVLKFFPSSNRVTFYAGAGAYFQEHSDLVQNQTTTKLYERSGDTKFTLAYSGGVEFGKSGGLHFGLGYHSVRGTNGQIYIKF